MFFVNLILLSFVELLYLVGVLIGVGFLLGALEKRSNFYIQRAFGRKGIYMTAWIGTPIHEAGHFIQCIIWRHKVTDVKFLQLNEPNGILGYVEHQYSTASLYQMVGNFFIGLGPIFSGIGSLVLGMYIFVPHSYELFINSLQNYHMTVGQNDLNVLKTIGIS